MAQAISKMETTMAQQTAVEFLVNELRLNLTIYKHTKNVIDQAKAIEKEQMHKCASFWRGKQNEIEKPMFDLYYNETYEL